MAKIKYFLLGLLIGVILVGSASVVKAYLLKQKVLGESTVTVATLDLSTTPQTAGDASHSTCDAWRVVDDRHDRADQYSHI